MTNQLDKIWEEKTFIIRIQEMIHDSTEGMPDSLITEIIQTPINYRERIAAVDGTNNEMYQEHYGTMYQTKMLHHAKR